MKKILSILLASILLLSVPATVLASELNESCNCAEVPIINLPGAMIELYEKEYPNKEVFTPTGDSIAASFSPVVDELKSALIPPNWEKVADAIIKFVYNLGGEIFMNEKGESIKDLTWVGPDGLNICDPYAQNHRENRIYTFNYDWRIDPLDIADELDAYINDVIASSGHSKVNLRTPSGANSIITAYLYKYGHEKINGLLMWNSLHNGSGTVGQLACKDLAFDSKALADGKLFRLIQMGDLQDSIEVILKLLSKLGILEIAAGVGNLAINKAINRLYDEAITPFFFHMPFIWAYVPDDYYEEAKKLQFGNDPKYKELIEKIDRYHYEVQLNSNALIKAASDDGVKLGMVCSYGYPGIPLVKDAGDNTDTVVEVSRSSGGAVSSRAGKTLGLFYLQKDLNEYNYISPDRMIDASTGVLPEYTWYIKYVYHFEPMDWRDTFAKWLFDYPGRANVRSDANYPQFMKWDEKSGAVTPLTSSDGVVGFSLLNPLYWMVDMWMKVINLAVKFGTWWLPFFGIVSN